MPLERCIKLFRLSCCVNRSPIVIPNGNKVNVEFTDGPKQDESEQPAIDGKVIKVEDEIDDEVHDDIENEFISIKPSMLRSSVISDKPVEPVTKKPSKFKTNCKGGSKCEDTK